MEALERALGQVSDFVWGWPMVVLLASTHLYLTVRLGFPQRHILKGIRISFTRSREGQGDISQFGAMVTALAATVGTGNIVGVSTAVAAGGPGAVLWMWLTGVFGISTKFAEALLAVKYRVQTPQGTMAGGPMYALERGLGARWLGVLFAAFTALAAFGIGNMVQANSLADLAKDSLGVPAWATGLGLMGLTGVVVLGGIKWIARACEGLVPFMVVGYLLGCAYLLVLGWRTLGDSALLILQSAFTGQAAVGGFLGAGVKEAVRYGVARGLFSNESGLGSAPIVAAAAQTRDPVRQAMVSATGTFWDTVVVCLVTGLVVVNSGLWQQGLKGAELTHAVFAQAEPLGPIVLTVGLATFVFTTILGWSYYGEKAIEYLAGPRAVLPYRLAWVGAVLLGAVASMPAVWAFSDIANALMALPNLVVLLLLSGVVAREARGYFRRPGAP